MDRHILKAFWDCGDNQIIEFALQRARLNKVETEVVHLMLDECMTQEEASEYMCLSTRRLQDYWYSASKKLTSIPWVYAYGKEICTQNECLKKVEA